MDSVNPPIEIPQVYDEQGDASKIRFAKHARRATTALQVVYVTKLEPPPTSLETPPIKDELPCDGIRYVKRSRRSKSGIPPLTALEIGDIGESVLEQMVSRFGLANFLNNEIYELESPVSENSSEVDWDDKYTVLVDELMDTLCPFASNDIEPDEPVTPVESVEPDDSANGTGRVRRSLTRLLTTRGAPPLPRKSSRRNVSL